MSNQMKVEVARRRVNDPTFTYSKLKNELTNQYLVTGKVANTGSSSTTNRNTADINTNFSQLASNSQQSVRHSTPLPQRDGNNNTQVAANVGRSLSHSNQTPNQKERRSQSTGASGRSIYPLGRSQAQRGRR